MKKPVGKIVGVYNHRDYLGKFTLVRIAPKVYGLAMKNGNIARVITAKLIEDVHGLDGKFKILLNE